MLTAKPVPVAIGQQCGHWVVLEPAGNGWWLCKCACGTIRTIIGHSIRYKQSRSCGCIRKEIARAACLTGRLVKHRIRATHGEGHGDARTPTYISWSSMKQRCENPKAPDYPRYGGRGITFCDQWRSYEVFRSDMGLRPEGLTLDRIENNGNYGPTNCQWATPKQQAKNRRRSIVRKPTQRQTRSTPETK
jgi:hypothetical protein